MEFLTAYLVPFLVVLTLLVFVHELGHYWVARRNQVRVEVFSIGFGPEIFGWNDRAGTRWKISAIPLGGYVRFHGDEDAFSRPADGSDDEPGGGPPLDLSRSFHQKRLGQRAAIVVAGPAANFLFAIVLLAGLFAIVGRPSTPPDVGAVSPGSAAAEAGLMPGDRFLSLAGSTIDRFEDIQQIVRLRPTETMTAVLLRDGREMSVTLTPRLAEVTDRFGNVHRIGMLGISRGGTVYERLDPARSVLVAAEETVSLTGATLTALGQIVAGTRTTDELGGPIRIAQMSGEAAQTGAVAAIWFMALLSINLGLINLFPIPMLDGGHLVFYAVEWVRGRPLGEKAQDYGFRVGFALVLGLMLFATWNDLVHLRVFEFLKALVT